MQPTQLNNLVDQFENRQKSRKGPGETEFLALFLGASRAAKTLAAIELARRLGNPLLWVDLSQVVSKYIGETEKNIDRLFTAARESGAILFFDEAEALFGKRTAVKDSHDRYANLDISYLLQLLESFEGIVILATNHKENMEEAFVRRLRFVVDFPPPDAK